MFSGRFILVSPESSRKVLRFPADKVRKAIKEWLDHANHSTSRVKLIDTSSGQILLQGNRFSQTNPEEASAALKLVA
jgi:hypothetical protein